MEIDKKVSLIVKDDTIKKFILFDLMVIRFDSLSKSYF